MSNRNNLISALWKDGGVVEKGFWVTRQDHWILRSALENPFYLEFMMKDQRTIKIMLDKAKEEIMFE